MNAVKAYFNRNWTREDLMNTGEVSAYAYRSLTMVYLSLFCFMLSFTLGSLLHSINREVGGLFTVLSSVASLLWLYFESPLRERLRLSLMLYAACTLGASFCLVTKNLFKVHPPFIVDLLEGSTSSFGVICIFFHGIDMLNTHTVHWAFKVNAAQALLMVYLVIYSQDLLYNADIGEINTVDRALAFFFHSPGIVVHAARVCLTAENEQHREDYYYTLGTIE
ncbi:bax inhibitor 1-like isoform X2 [Solanum pennellii]|uniref:Bax inhibitor 1-like isoform X2 n=1 Tax=Solanum pennellii TaxID=28526 RepID=A0ABM1GAL7_SOLPN|nr:bax inhibitor 1-like isoform X2 [Solanum pennellii]